MNWKLAIFSIALLPLLVFLGFWQLDRAEQKREIAERLEAIGNGAAVTLSEFLRQPERYQRVRLTGSYLVEHWLLDNQIHEGTFGYRVLTPFCTLDRCIMVDRGWVQGSLSRQELPELPTPKQLLTLEGVMDRASSRIQLGAPEYVSDSPYRVASLDWGQIETRLSRDILPWVLRLRSAQPGTFHAGWTPLVQGPEKHIGYAVQWFAMATVLVGLVLWTLWRAGRSRTERVDPA